MKLRWLIVYQAVCLATFAAEDVVELKEVHASLSYIYLYVGCVANTDRIALIRVTWIAPGSTAEKAGLRVGDRLTTINGVPVVGRERYEVMTKTGSVAVRGTEVTFAGRRGLFRTNWSLIATIDAKGTMEPVPNKEAPSQPREPTDPKARGSP
jgi:hypothetical protein